MDYISCGWRTSYFVPLDLEAARKFSNDWSIILRHSQKGDGTICFLSEEGAPGYREGIEEQDNPDWSDVFYLEMGALIPGNWRVIAQEAGAEGMRYISGSAFVVGPTGIESVLHLNDIYDRIDRRRVHVTDCEY